MYTYGWANTELQWNNLELENFKDKINEVTGIMAAVYGGDHKFFGELAVSILCDIWCCSVVHLSFLVCCIIVAW